MPYVSQLNSGGGLNDPMECWYCSAMMLPYHFEAGLRLSVPEFYGPSGHMATGSGTYGHASVMIGSEDSGSQIIYHDPEGQASTGAYRNARTPAVTFHQLRQKWRYATMQREGVISSMV
jgi:hypothetical protein